MNNDISMTLAPSLKVLLKTAILDSMAQHSHAITIESFLAVMLADDQSRELLQHCGAHVQELRDSLAGCPQPAEDNPPFLISLVLSAEDPGAILAYTINGLSAASKDGLAERDRRHTDFYQNCIRNVLVIADEVTKLCKSTSESRSEPCVLAGCLERSLLGAAFQKAASGRSTISEADVLDAMFDETESPGMRLLARQHVSRVDLRNYISHRISKLTEQTADQSGGFLESDLFDVVMHNDDFTTMQFVVDVLRAQFDKSHSEAYALMMRVHEQGKTIVGSYQYPVASGKAHQVISQAHALEFPFLCTVERRS